MYIRRKVFSVLVDETGEERLYSVNETILEGYEEREFAEKKEEEESPRAKRKRLVALKDVKSHRGLGRSYLLGGLNGALGGYVGKKHADTLDAEGASDEEILRGSKKRGALAGAAIGAGLGAVNAASLAKFNKPLAIGAAIGGTAAGALGGYLGADKNTRTRLSKRKLRELELEERIKKNEE